VNEKSFVGRTPLLGAVLANQKDVVLFLLRNGADPNAQDAV
jgi:ankyrin repeat protein